MEIKIDSLNGKEKREGRIWLKSYKYLYRCNICKKIYGSDYYEGVVPFCLKCEQSFRKKKK